jgi:hypothetical protein
MEGMAQGFEGYGSGYKSCYPQHTPTPVRVMRGTVGVKGTPNSTVWHCHYLVSEGVAGRMVLMKSCNLKKCTTSSNFKLVKVCWGLG